MKYCNMFKEIIVFVYTGNINLNTRDWQPQTDVFTYDFSLTTHEKNAHTSCISSKIYYLISSSMHISYSHSQWFSYIIFPFSILHRPLWVSFHTIWRILHFCTCTCLVIFITAFIKVYCFKAKVWWRLLGRYFVVATQTLIGSKAEKQIIT